MSNGSVKWFNNAKGFGFILPEDKSEDYFVHYSSIVVEGYKTLKAGQAVTFDMIDGPKGTHAVNVQPLTLTEHESPCGNDIGADDQDMDNHEVEENEIITSDD
jgi:cold shock protein